MTSPTPSNDSLNGTHMLGSLVDPSFNSSTFNSIVRPHLSSFLGPIGEPVRGGSNGDASRPLSPFGLLTIGCKVCDETFQKLLCHLLTGHHDSAAQQNNQQNESTQQQLHQHNEFLQENNTNNDFFSSSKSVTPESGMDLTSKFLGPLNIKSPSIKRQKMIYHCKFGEFGTGEAQFTEPSGVAVTGNMEIVVADTNNHRIQVRLKNFYNYL
jgi:hypothetical protein